MADILEVLFVCTHNAGRSQMAAALLDQMAAGWVLVTSAESRPADQLCGDGCPVYPGKRYLDWDLPDPAGLPLEQVRPIRDRIRDHVTELVAELTG